MPVDEQERMANIRRAQRARLAQAELRAALKRGDINPWAAIRGDVPEWEPTIRKMPLMRLLRSLKLVGENIAMETCIAAQLPTDVKLMALSFSKRAEVAEICHTIVAHGTAPGVPEPLSPAKEAEGA